METEKKGTEISPGDGFIFTAVTERDGEWIKDGGMELQTLGSLVGPLNMEMRGWVPIQPCLGPEQGTDLSESVGEDKAVRS